MTYLRLKHLILFLFLTAALSSIGQITRIDTVKQSIPTVTRSNYETPILYMYSIGVKAFSLEEFPKILNQTQSDKFINTNFNGLYLKLNDNQISYRMAGSYYSKNITFRNECEDCEEANGKLTDFSTSIGFEKNFIYGTLQPYFAFDIGYRRNTFKGDVKSASTATSTTPYDVNTLKNCFLMSPNFGLKINVVNHISLMAEAGLNLLYSYEKQEKILKDAARTRSLNQYNKWEFLLKPVSLISLQYNFGQSY